MKIIANHKTEGIPQRQLLKNGLTTYRRIVRTIDSLTQKLSKEKLPFPWWQEQIHNGDFHTIPDTFSIELEKTYQKEIEESEKF